MKICYISHPISGNIEKNLFSIRSIVREINLTQPDIVPFVPYYVDIVSLDDNNPIERERGIKNDTRILTSGIVAELWLYGDRISKGMEAEIELAKQMGIRIISKSQNIVLV